MLKDTVDMSWPSYIIKLLTEADMAYNSTLFFIFLALFLVVYLILWNKKLKAYWVLLGSITFYAWSGLWALMIVVGTAIVTYIVTRRIEWIYRNYDVEKEGLSPKRQAVLFNSYKKKAVKYLWAALFVILSIWIMIKVGKLLQYDTVTSLRDMYHGLGIIVPLGISYYTLSATGYVLDVYWRKAEVEHNFLQLFSAMIYFPYIIQGPISKYQDIMKQMNNLPKVDYDRVCYGLQLMLWGYIKKMIVADRLTLYTDTIFASPGTYAGVEIVIAVFLCVIQLYADFSGCMDIVRGISQVLGIELEKNFRQPFFARNAQEFWTRWHITLGAWTKDYIYMPIAMNSKFMKYTRTMKKSGKAWMASFIKSFCPLITVWVFTGLWHGTGWDYLVWGLYWCMIMTISKECKPISDKIANKLSIDRKTTAYQVWEMIRTCILFAVGRMLTVTGSLEGCLTLWKQIFAEARLWTLFDGSLYNYGLDSKDFYVAMAFVAVIFAVDILHERGMEIRLAISRRILPIRWIIYLTAIVAVVIFGMYGPGFDAASFVYGAF